MARHASSLPRGVGRRQAPLPALALAIPLCVLGVFAAKTGRKTQPPARRDGVVDVVHGVRVPDPYRWLENPRSPETRQWVTAQDAYTRPILDSLPGRDATKQRLTALMKVEFVGLPTERGGRYFFMRRAADQDLALIEMRQGIQGADQVLVNPLPMSTDHSTSVGLMAVSESGRLLAYGVRRGGQDEVEVHVLNVDERNDLKDVLPHARYNGLSFLPDGRGFYYSRQNPNGPRLYYHKIGTQPAGDREIFGSGYGTGDFIAATVSEDGRYLSIEVSHGASRDHTELYLQNLATRGPIQTVVKGIAARFDGDVAGDQLYVETNWKAPNGRILVTDPAKPEDLAPQRWREIVPENGDSLDSFSPIGGKLFVRYLHSVTSKLEEFNADGHPVQQIPLPGLGSVSGPVGRWKNPEAFLGFSSFLVPFTIYRYDAQTGTSAVWARVRVPLDPARYRTEQVWYRSKDGTRVPMFLAYPKSLKKDGQNPALMTAYGGFDISLTPRFSPEAATWVESGGVFAQPNLRGGGEFGEKWHKAGMLGRKQNVFDDFYAAAEWLVKNGYTRPAKLAATGTSNGGLLMGAAITQRPDLFRAIVCRYPLLDMLRYQRFLVARFWVPEYGSAENAGQFPWLYAYSPYQHVKKGTRYPAILFVSGDGDTRVDPLHARKMAALMQWATAGTDRPVLLAYDSKSGHSGGRPLSKQIDELTDELAFIRWRLGAR